MKKIKTLLIVAFVLAPLMAVAQQQQPANWKYMSFGATSLNDEDYNKYIGQLRAALTEWMLGEGKKEPREYSWEVLVKPSGWNKVSLQVSAVHIPPRFGGITIPTFTKVAKGSEDAKSAMEPLIKYMVDLPKSLERSPYRKQ